MVMVMLMTLGETAGDDGWNGAAEYVSLPFLLGAMRLSLPLLVAFSTDKVHIG